jgi:hypothetical protein
VASDADRLNHRVRRIDPLGAHSTVGVGRSGTGDNATRATLALNSPCCC